MEVAAGSGGAPSASTRERSSNLVSHSPGALPAQRNEARRNRLHTGTGEVASIEPELCRGFVAGRGAVAGCPLVELLGQQLARMHDVAVHGFARGHRVPGAEALQYRRVIMGRGLGPALNRGVKEGGYVAPDESEDPGDLARVRHQVELTVEGVVLLLQEGKVLSLGGREKLVMKRLQLGQFFRRREQRGAGG